MLNKKFSQREISERDDIDDTKATEEEKPEKLSKGLRAVTQELLLL